MDLMDFFTRCAYLSQNPVVLARNFQYRFEMLFKVIVIDGPLGKVKYHAIRIEFHVLGSPHVYSILWVHDSAILGLGCYISNTLSFKIMQKI